MTSACSGHPMNVRSSSAMRASDAPEGKAHVIAVKGADGFDASCSRCESTSPDASWSTRNEAMTQNVSRAASRRRTDHDHGRGGHDVTSGGRMGSP